jgi:hypothetical protein
MLNNEPIIGRTLRWIANSDPQITYHIEEAWSYPRAQDDEP